MQYQAKSFIIRHPASPKLLNKINEQQYSSNINSGMKTVYLKQEEKTNKEETLAFPIVPDQIHKVPQSIRRAIKVGKHRRGGKQKNVPNSQQFNGSMSNLQLYKDKQKISTDLHVRQIFNFIPRKQQRSEQQYANMLKGSKDKQEGYQPHLYHMYKGQTSKLRTSGDRMLYVKKKLSPLKKGLSIQPRSLPSRDQRNLKVTFLNIEKLELIKMYQNMDENKQLAAKKAMSMTSSMVNNNNEYLVQNFLESASFSNSKTPLLKRSMYSQDNSPTKSLKPFSPPFDRYYYRDFIWKIAFNHGLHHESPQSYEKKFKVYIGRGNNSLLVKSLFKRRRSWWAFTERVQDANFIWTQTKVNNIFANQPTKQSQYIQLAEDADQINKESQIYIQHSYIISQNDYILWKKYITRQRRIEDILDETMKKRNKYLGREKVLDKLKHRSIRMHNHLPNNYIIGNKKALFYTMSQYYEKTNQKVFEYLPLTFHIQNGLEDNQYLKFLNMFYNRAKKIRARNKANMENSDSTFTDEKSVKNIWIVKPGQFTNRGNGITVCMTLDQIKQILKKKQRHDNGNLKTYILQSYLEKPFLYQRRKFDIRHFIMMSSINGIVRGYWYELGYIRTTSFEYSINNSFTSVHLTNDAVQKYLPEYGKYEKGNKVSYEDFQKYLEKQYGKKYDFYKEIYPKLKTIASDAMRACSLMIDPEKKGHNFEIFGLDFMIDEDFHPWLIEINNNPCLETSCPLLADIIPDMVENAIRICIDPIFPPPANFSEKRPKFNQNAWQQNKFKMVYDSSREQKDMLQLYNGQMKLELDYKQLEKQQDQVFEDDGIELQD